MNTRKKRLSSASLLLIISICFTLMLTGCGRMQVYNGGADPENIEDGGSPEPVETASIEPVPSGNDHPDERSPEPVETESMEPVPSKKDYTLRVEFFLDSDLPWEEDGAVNAFRIFKVTGDQEDSVYTFDKAEYLVYEKLMEDYTVVEGFSDLEGSLVFYFYDDLLGDSSILVIGEEDGSYIEKYYGYAYDFILEDVDGDGSTEILTNIFDGERYASWWMDLYIANTAGEDGRYEPSYDLTRKYYYGLRGEAEALFNADRNPDTFRNMIEANIYLGDNIKVEDLLLKYESIADKVNKEFLQSGEGDEAFSYFEFSVYLASCYASMWKEIFPDD